MQIPPRKLKQDVPPPTELDTPTAFTPILVQAEIDEDARNLAKANLSQT
jgi:hypothetical protein